MGKIYLVGLGPGDENSLSLGSYRILKKVSTIFIRTKYHPTVDFLENENIGFRTFDHLYDESESFDDVYDSIKEAIIGEVKEKGEIVYAVPGHPLVAEESVLRIIKAANLHNIDYEIIAGGSFLEEIFRVLHLDPLEGISVFDALDEDKLVSTPTNHLIITQVYSRRVASRVKLSLQEIYPDEHPVKLIRCAGIKGMERIQECPLWQIDHFDWIDHLTTLFVPRLSTGSIYALLDTMKKLRSSEGCPWDQQQTHESLCKYVLEEAYEVVSAIDSGNTDHICEELGDLLLQVVFHSQLAAENGDFNFFSVAEKINKKIVARHPHVFSTGKADTVEEVKQTWQEQKLKEGKKKKGVCDVEKYLPALMQSEKIQARAAEVGFDWNSIDGAWGKVVEELEELKNVYKLREKEKIEEELGDLLFSIVNVARFLKINPEIALLGTVNKFSQRFAYIEEQVKEEGGIISNYSLEELDRWWEKAKNLCKKSKKT